MTKHARFLHIEPGSTGANEPGTTDAPPASESADRARIAAVLAAAPRTVEPGAMELAEDAPAGDGAPPDWAGRAPQMLEEPPEDAPAAMALDVAMPEGQPFVRCARCGADSTIHATACANCGERLDTAEQRAHNDRVWEALRREKERERAALAEMAAARFENAKQAARPLPEPGMTPPPELLEPLDEDGPMLFAALRALQEPRWRWAAGAAVTGLPLLLVTLGGPLLGKLGWFLVLLLVLSLLPRSAGRRLREMWDEARRR